MSPRLLKKRVCRGHLAFEMVNKSVVKRNSGPTINKKCGNLAFVSVTKRTNNRQPRPLATKLDLRVVAIKKFLIPNIFEMVLYSVNYGTCPSLQGIIY